MLNFGSNLDVAKRIAVSESSPVVGSREETADSASIPVESAQSVITSPLAQQDSDVPLSPKPPDAHAQLADPAAGAAEPISMTSTDAGQQIFLQNFSFNQDMTCFAIATSSDFRTFVLTPGGGLSEVSRRRVNTDGPSTGAGASHLLTSSSSPVNVCSMLFQTNYVALVMKSNPYKVLLWDDSLARGPHEIWSRFEVLNVLLRRDVFCVVSEYKTYLYQFGGSFQVLLYLETSSNPRGLCQLSPSGKDWVLACPGQQKGSVRIQIGLDDSVSSTVPAHHNSVAALGITSHGTMIASASDQGTVVKILNSADGQCIYELRRGTIGTQISSITFRSDNRFVVVGSSNPTIHVFKLDTLGSAIAAGQSMVIAKAQKIFGKLSEWAATANSPVLESVLAMAPPLVTGDYPSQPGGYSRGSSISGPPSSSVSAIGGVVPKYFQSSRSFATFRIPDFEAPSALSSVLSATSGSSSSLDLRVVKSSPICGPIVSFSKPNHVVVIHYNGLMYEFSFDDSKTDGGQEGVFLGACAYFQARPDFTIQKSTFVPPAQTSAQQFSDGKDDEEEESNWHVL